MRSERKFEDDPLEQILQGSSSGKKYVKMFLMNDKRKFAFIDVQNTETTTRRVLGFLVDWMKLYKFLKVIGSAKSIFLHWNRCW